MRPKLFCSISMRSNILTNNRIPEHSTLQAAVESHIPIPVEGLEFLMKKVRQPVPLSLIILIQANQSEYYHLDSQCSILDNLKDLEILEYPTILVVDKSFDGWVIIEKPQGTDHNV